MIVICFRAAMTGAPFLNSAYIYMNVFVLAFGFWSIVSPDSSDSILMVRIWEWEGGRGGG